jgi:tetratricopeptide (TPR) repeat protein
MRNKNWVVSIAAFGLLLACDNGAGPLSSGAAKAPGIDASKEQQDPMLVGQRLLQAGELELALRAFYRAAAIEGLSARVLTSIGTTQLSLGRLGQAEDTLRQAIEADATYVPAWNNLGAVLIEQGQWGEAVRVLETAFALDSGESAEIQQNLQLALANFNAKSYPETEEPDFDLLRRGAGDYLLMSTEK